jgi:LCP family protein required for cell wall assembly
MSEGEREGPGGPGEREPDDERRAEDRSGQGQDSGFDTEESSGLGLTEEFARIEAEIESEVSESPDDAPPAGEPERPEEPEESEGSEPAEGLDQAEEADAEELEPVAEEPERVAEEPEEALEGAAELEQSDGSVEAEAEPGEQADEAPAAPEVDDETAIHAPAGTHPVLPPHQPAPAPGAVPAPAPASVPIAAAVEEVPAPKTPRLWLRFLSGSLLIVAAAASAVAGGGLLFLTDIAESLQPIPGIQGQLTGVEGDQPQTILIIGSDRRAGTAKQDRRSDTTMLLRVDPDKDILSLFSLPRDLKVDIPGVGTDKLNAAYSIGGEKLTLRTVKQLTGLEINHVVEINFGGFADAVDAIDCVYVDVDREYFNDNSTATDGGFAAIDINAGYQRLCGLKALQYVRFRHTDTDLVRAARQQDFLREARQKVEPRELLPVIGGKGNELIDIFTEHTRSDIANAADVLNVLSAFVAVRDASVNEVHFQGNIGPEVTSTDEQVRTAIDQFLNGAGSSGQRGGDEADKDEDAEKKSKKKDKKKDKDPRDEATAVATETLADEKFPTQAERFKADAEKDARRLRIPVFYPTKVAPGSTFSTDSRTYEYENEENEREAAYKTVIALTTPSTLRQYYGVMGTTWDDPPILRNPSETRRIGGREYLLFYDGGRLRLVGWMQDGNSYWLNNTLTQSVSEGDMLAIATSMDEV